MNQADNDARKLTYVQFPSKFVWNKNEHTWSKRKIGQSIGRIYNVHPSSGELYFLKLLINHVKGPRGYDDLLTFNDKVYKTFKEACVARGLLEGDNEWHDAMKEVVTWAIPKQLRQLFVMLLVHCEVSNPFALWSAWWKDLSEDMLYQQRRLLNYETYILSESDYKNYALIELELLLSRYDQSLSDYPDMPAPCYSVMRNVLYSSFLDEHSYDMHKLKAELDKNECMLNKEQKVVYDVVLASVYHNSGKLVFLIGPGGTCKTFVYKTIINKMLLDNLVVIPVASSGIAALLLPGGRTTPSRFKIPLNLMDDSVCDIKTNSMLADLIISARLIIWDEAPMTHKYAFEALDRSLRDVMMKCDPEAHLKPFGGKTILLGCDFRQTLPIIALGSRQDSVLASINRSFLWVVFEIYSLSQNMRIDQSYITFDKWILQVGDGTAEKIVSESNNDSCEDHICVDQSLFLPSTNDPIKALLDYVYASFNENVSNIEYLKGRAILCPRNDTVDGINKIMLSSILGRAQCYLSVDSMSNNEYSDSDCSFQYPIEYLNSLAYPNFPQHKLLLKVNAPVMLIRNLCQRDGLCNGTRLVITRLGLHVIEAKIITGDNSGRLILIPRIALCQTEGKCQCLCEGNNFRSNLVLQ